MPDSALAADYGNRVLYISMIGGLFFFMMIINLVRKRYLTERYALAWLMIPLLITFFSSNRNLLERLAALVGIYYAPALMIPIMFALFILVSLYFSVKASQSEYQIKTLTQELALLKYRFEKFNPEPEKESGQSSNFKANRPGTD